MAFSDCFRIVRYNGKILSKRYLLSGLIYAALLPMVYSFQLLQMGEVVRISEIPFSLLGVLLLTAMGEVDFEDGVGEIVSTKRMNKGVILLYRLGLGILALGIITGALLLWMVFQGSRFDFGTVYMCALINQLFLGVLGITAANLCRNAVAGYLVSISYFFVEFTTKGKYTGVFYLFSLTRNDLTAKWWLLGVTLILVTGNLLYLRRRSLN